MNKKIEISELALKFTNISKSLIQKVLAGDVNVDTNFGQRILIANMYIEEKENLLLMEVKALLDQQILNEEL